MKKSIKYAIFIVLSSFIFFSCVSGKIARDNSRVAYKHNDYETAISYLKEENQEGDLIDLNLDEAMLLSLNGNYKESASLFNRTNQQMSLLSGELTVGQMITAGLSSENSIKYSGPAYEYSLLDSMNAFNYMKLGDYDNARAMMRRSFNNNKKAFNELKAKQRELNRQSELAFNSESTQSAIRDMSDEGLYYDFDLFKDDSDEPGYTEYNLSPFNFYLGAILFANDNDINTAKDWLVNIKPYITSELSDSIVNIPAGKGSVNVVSFADTIVRREEAVQYVPMISDSYGLRINFKLTWPYVPKTYNVVDSVIVKVSKAGEENNIVAIKNAELLEDFDEAVRNDVMSKATGSFVRSLIRNITRKTAAYIGGILAVETANELAEEAGVSELVETIAVINAVTALQLTINAIDAGEHADTRQCVFFPSKARGAGIILDPGVYDITVEYVKKNGKVVKSDFFENVEVEEGRNSIVSSEYINTGNFIYKEKNQNY